MHYHISLSRETPLMKPSLLLASFLSGLAVLAAVLVTGCASSERMNRLAWDSDS